MRALGGIPTRAAGKGSSGTGTAKPGSAAISPNPSAPPPSQGLVGGTPQQGGQPYGQAGQPASGQSVRGPVYGARRDTEVDQELQKKKSPIGWWIAGGVLVIVIIVVAVMAIRAVTGGDTGTTGDGPAGQPSQDFCPPENTASPDAPVSHPADGRVHGGPVSYPMLGAPWGPPQGPPNPVPFGTDVQTQMVLTSSTMTARAPIGSPQYS